MKKRKSIFWTRRKVNNINWMHQNFFFLDRERRTKIQKIILLSLQVTYRFLPFFTWENINTWVYLYGIFLTKRKRLKTYTDIFISFSFFLSVAFRLNIFFLNICKSFLQIRRVTFFFSSATEFPSGKDGSLDSFFAINLTKCYSFIYIYFFSEVCRVGTEPKIEFAKAM